MERLREVLTRDTRSRYKIFRTRDRSFVPEGSISGLESEEKVTLSLAASIRDLSRGIVTHERISL